MESGWCHSAAEDQPSGAGGSQARKTRGKFWDKTEVSRYMDEGLCGVGCSLGRVEGHKTLSG